MCRNALFIDNFKKECVLMFKKFTNGCVRVVNRWLPDAFLFAVILTIVVFLGAMLATGMGPVAMLNAWGNNVFCHKN